MDSYVMLPYGAWLLATTGTTTLIRALLLRAMIAAMGE
jgi:hypothetical protein